MAEQPPWDPADGPTSLRAFAEWLHGEATEMFLKDGTHGNIIFLFDETGCPVNPLDNLAARQYCPNGAPADNFAANVANATNNDGVFYDLDRIVENDGDANSSSAHPFLYYILECGKMADAID